MIFIDVQWFVVLFKDFVWFCMSLNDCWLLSLTLLLMQLALLSFELVCETSSDCRRTGKYTSLWKSLRRSSSLKKWGLQCTLSDWPWRLIPSAPNRQPMTLTEHERLRKLQLWFGYCHLKQQETNFAIRARESIDPMASRFRSWSSANAHIRNLWPAYHFKKKCQITHSNTWGLPAKLPPLLR